MLGLQQGLKPSISSQLQEWLPQVGQLLFRLKMSLRSIVISAGPGVDGLSSPKSGKDVRCIACQHYVQDSLVDELQAAHQPLQARCLPGGLCSLWRTNAQQ